MKTIYFDWEPCFQQNNVFKWWGRSFFLQIDGFQFLVSWSLMESFFRAGVHSLINYLGCNPCWWRSPTLSFLQSNIGFKLHKTAKLSQTVLKSSIVCNWLLPKTRDQNIYHVVLYRSFVLLEGVHGRGDIQNRETIPGRLLTKDFGRWSLFSDNFLPPLPTLTLTPITN